MTFKWTEFKLRTSPRTFIPAYRKNFGSLGHGIVVPYNRKFDWDIFVYDSERKPRRQFGDTADTFEEAKECVEAYFAGLYEVEGSIER